MFIYYWIKWLFRHRCKFMEPIVSMYLSFNCRKIIWQCKCGNKKVFREYTDFSRDFTIDTNIFITYNEFKEILNSKEIYKTE